MNSEPTDDPCLQQHIALPQTNGHMPNCTTTAPAKLIRNFFLLHSLSLLLLLFKLFCCDARALLAFLYIYMCCERQPKVSCHNSLSASHVWLYECNCTALTTVPATLSYPIKVMHWQNEYKMELLTLIKKLNRYNWKWEHANQTKKSTGMNTRTGGPKPRAHAKCNFSSSPNDL